MRIGELVTGLRYMTTNEQRGIFELLKEMKSVTPEQLDERAQQVAHEMHTMGLIDRQINEDTQEITYRLYKR
jgi:hypothetical protein